jgi:hypothetical protein
VEEGAAQFRTTDKQPFLNAIMTLPTSEDDWEEHSGCSSKSSSSSFSSSLKKAAKAKSK